MAAMAADHGPELLLVELPGRLGLAFVALLTLSWCALHLSTISRRAAEIETDL
jgi:hypothetical protein